MTSTAETVQYIVQRFGQPVVVPSIGMHQNFLVRLDDGEDYRVDDTRAAWP